MKITSIRAVPGGAVAIFLGSTPNSTVGIAAL